MPEPIGVAAIQGDYAKHIEALLRVDSTLDVREVRTPEDLAAVDRLILPGGESTTVGKLMQRFGLGAALQERVEAGMPVWGTCMGMILLASLVEDSDQFSLKLLDITVRRNAFGAQVHSFEDTVSVDGIGDVTGVFIRAPIVTRLGPGATATAHYGSAVVAVRQGNRLGTSFHPELTDDSRMHEYFLGL